MLAFNVLPAYDVYIVNRWKFLGKKKLTGGIDRSILVYL